MEKLNETGNDQVETSKNNNDVEWEKNHTEIGNFIMEYVRMEGIMPNKSLIAKGTKLSRETVYKHLSSYAESPVKARSMGNYDMMIEPVMTRVLRSALAGDLKAVRLFLEMREGLNKPQDELQAKQQNNYLQINKTIVNQKIIQQLKPEQLSKIEEIIATEMNNQGVDRG